MFNKALNSSNSSLGESVLEECFGETKQKIGSNLQKLFVNTVAKVDMQLQDSFKSICSNHDIDAPVVVDNNIVSNTTSAGLGTDADSDDIVTASNVVQPLKQMVSILHEKEMLKLQEAIAEIEKKMVKQKELSAKLKSQVENEVAAVNEQRQMIATAADQIL